MAVSRAFRILAALAALAAVPSLHAQDGDEGSFRVLVGGEPVGTEEFVIRTSGSGTNTEITATGRVVLQPVGAPADTLASRLRATGLRAAPVRYEVEVRGEGARKVVGTVGGGRVSAKTITASGEQLREYVASDNALVLEDGMAHLYYFVAHRGAGRFPVILPRENRQVLAVVTNRGEERVEVNGTPLRLFHLVVEPAGGDARHVWVDALNRVIRVEVPARSYLAVRTTVPR